MEMHWPQAKVIRWIDGDTVELQIDTGFDNSRKEQIRLIIVNTPEEGQPGYQEAKDAVNAWAPPGTIVTVTTYKHDAWKRYLGDVVCSAVGQIHQELLRVGLGSPYKKR